MDFRSVPRMRQSFIVIDDFLDNPDLVRESVLSGGIEQFCHSGSFSGRRTFTADPSYQQMINSKLEKILPFKFEMDDYLEKDSEGNPITESCCFAFQLALETDTTWVHNDTTDWSGVLYLTPNALIESGTILFKKGTKPDPDKVDEYNSLLTDTVGNLYNRMILFNGKNLPHRSNLPGFGDCLENGRLSQHFFFDEVK